MRLGVKYLVCRKLKGHEGKNHKEELSVSINVNLIMRETDEVPFYVPHDSISRRHAILWCKPHVEGGLELRVRDLGTTNGTFVNDERLAQGCGATKIVGG